MMVPYSACVSGSTLNNNDFPNIFGESETLATPLLAAIPWPIAEMAARPTARPAPIEI